MSAEHLITPYTRNHNAAAFSRVREEWLLPGTFHSDVPCFQFIYGGGNQLELHEWGIFSSLTTDSGGASSHDEKKNICYPQKTAYLAPCLQPPVKSSITVTSQRADFFNAAFQLKPSDVWSSLEKIWSECYEWINNMNDMNLQPPPDLWEEIILVVRLLILLLHFLKQTKENNIKLGQQYSDVVEYLLWWRHWFWGLSSQGRTCHEFTDRPETQITVRKHWPP